MSSLSKSQTEKLYLKAQTSLSEGVFSLPIEFEKETSYTQRVILPFVSKWVASLNENGLHVRGDGGLNPLRIVWDGISFFPDVTIMQFNDRLVAYEIKFLRSEDPGGSLTKALGQTLIYERAGFECSVGLVLDCRNILTAHIGFKHSETITLSPNSTLFIFKPII